MNLSLVCGDLSHALINEPHDPSIDRFHDVWELFRAYLTPWLKVFFWLTIMDLLESRKSAIVNSLSHKLATFAKRRGVHLDPDSLLVKTTVNSAVHYAPQDIALWASAAFITCRGNKKVATPRPISDPDREIARFLNNHGLKPENVDIKRSRKQIIVNLRD